MSTSKQFDNSTIRIFFVAEPRNPLVSWESWFYLTLVAIALTGVLLTEYFLPISYVHLISEDRIGEYSTSVAFATAGVFFLTAGSRSAGVNRLFLIFMSIFSLFIAGEEISWGQRIIGIDTPEVVRQINKQGELTIHNIGPLQKLNFHVAAGILLQVLMLVSVFRDLLSKRFAWIGDLSLPALSIWPTTIVVSMILIARPMVKGDEIAEALLSFIVLFWALHTAFEFKVVKMSGYSRELMAMAILSMVVISGMFLSNAFGRDMGWRYNIAASRDYPERGMMEQSRILFEHIMSDPELIRPDTVENFRYLHE
ncbi:hypothetical protein [uncultured Jannaschia sp.]|uniref:hypothetical protein n=1 Tax=uncultured Jannaschia sp. TaxID=293347 RepID=UPI0026241ADB|nr:hypothetical protein [uncultured Jannaschia sp.]